MCLIPELVESPRVTNHANIGCLNCLGAHCIHVQKLSKIYVALLICHECLSASAIVQQGVNGQSDVYEGLGLAIFPQQPNLVVVLVPKQVQLHEVPVTRVAEVKGLARTQIKWLA
jgi:hypothetical protein